jgi:nucleoid-associated protein YgaU
MQKDLKIGFFVGLIIVAAASLWLATRRELSTKARLLRSQSVISTQKPQISEPAVEYEQNPPDYQMHWQTEKIKTTKFHIVRKGETLSAIAAKYYGSTRGWQKILDANKNVIKNPDMLAAGTKLTIPE